LGQRTAFKETESVYCSTLFGHSTADSDCTCGWHRFATFV